LPNATLTQLADEARKTLAINYLKAGNYPLKEISYMLGYNELSAFTHSNPLILLSYVKAGFILALGDGEEFFRELQ